MIGLPCKCQEPSKGNGIGFAFLLKTETLPSEKRDGRNQVLAAQERRSNNRAENSTVKTFSGKFLNSHGGWTLAPRQLNPFPCPFPNHLLCLICGCASISLQMKQTSRAVIRCRPSRHPLHRNVCPRSSWIGRIWQDPGDIKASPGLQLHQFRLV